MIEISQKRQILSKTLKHTQNKFIILLLQKGHHSELIINEIINVINNLRIFNFVVSYNINYFKDNQHGRLCS